MLTKIKLFFEQSFVIETVSPQQQRHSLNLSVAAIMLEMVISDNQIKPAELEQLQQLLEQQLDLDDSEIAQVTQLAEQELSDSTDYYQFTAMINQHFGRAQKLEIIKGLWQIAYADGEIDRFEEHYLRKVAALLHLPHSDFIKAKLSVIGG